MAFDEEYQEHWQEAGKVKDAVLKTVHHDGSRSQEFFAYKQCLTVEEGKVPYQNPVDDAAYVEKITLRRYPHDESKNSLAEVANMAYALFMYQVFFNTPTGRSYMDEHKRRQLRQF